jgi:hypothetical protein
LANSGNAVVLNQMIVAVQQNTCVGNIVDIVVGYPVAH